MLPTMRASFPLSVAIIIYPAGARDGLTLLLQPLQLGTHSFQARGKLLDSEHPNVTRVSIQRTIDEKSLAPPEHDEWQLPPVAILKRQKVGWEEEFRNEQVMYAKLRDLQGTVVPKYYGEPTCSDGIPSMLLSDVGGHPLWSPAAAGIPCKVLERLLDESLSALAVYNICHYDSKLDNFHLVDGKRVVVLDFETAEELKPADVDYSKKSDLDFLLDTYRRHQEGLKHDGLIKPDGSHKAHNF